MIQHCLKMIWAERKSNTWILIELIIVFSILWFCSEFMYVRVKQLLEPVGVDINHTYLLRFDFRKNVNSEDYLEDYDFPQDGITIMDRLKQYSAIENACFSTYWSTPYSGSFTGNSIRKDSIDYSYADRSVSPEYFDVFKIKFQAGKSFDPNAITSQKQVVASPEADNTFYKNEDITTLKEIIKEELEPGQSPKNKEEWEKALKHDVIWKVTGVVNKMKRSEFDPYKRILFFLMSREDFNPRQAEFCIRVKPQADKRFIETFQKEMAERLKVGPFELTSITPFSERRTQYLQPEQEKINTMLVVISFLLVNVFLGIVGTFRFRTNARQGEIGLRCALGSSKTKIRMLLLGETFLMLLLASIPATIIAVNIELSGILSKLGVSILEGVQSSIFEDKTDAATRLPAIALGLISYSITFVMMFVIIWLGTWYPAKKAAEVQPAEVLHYE